MADIIGSIAAYETWLERQLGDELVRSDLEAKAEAMGENPFVFLRATYWRWAETIMQLCPELASAPEVLAVGDIHLENFGTWRDADGRLVFGVNDFDEAAEMPYALDLVRLTTSALLAGEVRAKDASAVGTALLAGYAAALDAPKPIVLEQDWDWLRAYVVVPEARRAKFWKKIDARKPEASPERFRRALADAMPEPAVAFDTARRVAGTGSLGRPRWLGVADWRGAMCIREAKALLTSGWHYAQGALSKPLRSSEIATGRYRAPDPWYRVADGIVVRRLSPNNRKVDAEDLSSFLNRTDMHEVMGRELAGLHLGSGDHAAAIKADLKKRGKLWLAEAAMIAATAVSSEYKQFKKSLK